VLIILVDIKQLLNDKRILLYHKKVHGGTLIKKKVKQHHENIEQDGQSQSLGVVLLGVSLLLNLS
jgi:hypothetical protein